MSDKWLTVALGILMGGLCVLCAVVFLNIGPLRISRWSQTGPSVVLNKADLTQVHGNGNDTHEIKNVNTEDVSTEVISTEDGVAEEENQLAENTVPSGPAYYIKVNRLASCITVYGMDEEGNYTIPVKAMACSVGLNGRTPIATTKITNKYVWRQLYGGVYGQYAVRFNGHVLFHSVPYTSMSKNTLKSVAYNKLGEPASMGCVRLCVADAKWIYDNCEIGTVVEVYENEDPGPLGEPEPVRIDLESPNRGWDPTDPDQNNPWLTED